MRSYQVYFELYGKKMKCTILAESEESAKSKLKDKIVFHKIVLKDKDEFADLFDAMENFLGIKK